MAITRQRRRLYSIGVKTNHFRRGQLLSPCHTRTKQTLLKSRDF